GPDAAISHRAAAALWALGDFSSDWVELSTARNLRPPRAGPMVHRVNDLVCTDTALVTGIPLTSPARTLLDLCGQTRSIGRASVEDALDDALRRGLVSLPRLRWTATRVGGRGKPGTALLRRLLRQRGRGYVPPASNLEAKLI